MKRPTFDSNWPDEVKAVYEHDMREIWDRSIAPQVWNQYHNQLDLYLSLAGDEPSDVLDVGCAQATLALLLAERGHRVCALDIRQHFLDYARSRHTHGDIEFRCGNVLELALDRRFDLIFANQILEHLVYPEVVVSALAALLRPGGRLVATTPSWHYLMNRLPSLGELGDRAQWEHRQHTADGDGHFFSYKGGELSDVFGAAGLREIELRWFETPFISGHLKLRHVHRFTPTALLRLLDRTLLAVPRIGYRAAHQMMVTGIK